MCCNAADGDCCIYVCRRCEQAIVGETAEAILNGHCGNCECCGGER